MAVEGQAKIDEFTFILLAGIIFMIIMLIAFTTIKESLDVFPKSVSLTLQRGGSSTFTLTLNGSARNVSLSAKGEIAQFISFARNKLDVSGFENVDVTVNVPSGTVEKVYKGAIEIISSATPKLVNLEIDVRKVLPIAEVSRSISLGDFLVSFISTTETLINRGSLSVSKSYFSSFPVSLISDPISENKLSVVKGGSISILIEQTNSAGNLIVIFNGKEMFNRRVGAGEVFIPLSKDDFKRTNVLEIKSGNPGLRFWLASVYAIRTVTVNAEFEGKESKEISFALDENEIKNFRFGRVMFDLKRSEPKNDLVIRINDQQVFRGVVSQNSFMFDFESGTPLNVGDNKISFSAEKNSMYDIDDLTLLIVRKA